jgi:hypothetical protein
MRIASAFAVAVVLFQGQANAQSHFQERALEYASEIAATTNSSMVEVYWTSVPSGTLYWQTTFSASYEVCSFYNIASFSVMYGTIDISAYFYPTSTTIPNWCLGDGGEVYYVGSASGIPVHCGGPYDIVVEATDDYSSSNSDYGSFTTWCRPGGSLASIASERTQYIRQAVRRADRLRTIPNVALPTTRIRTASAMTAITH